ARVPQRDGREHSEHCRERRVSGGRRRRAGAHASSVARRSERVHEAGKVVDRCGSRRLGSRGTCMTPAIDLRIEELVLDGFPPSERYELAEGIERELTRLFTDRGAPAALAPEAVTDHLD